MRAFAAAGAAIMLAVLLAGCAGQHPHTYHQAGVQCEAMPWDGDQVGGSDDERLQRLRAHYEQAGYEVTDVAIYRYDTVVPAVCGAWDTTVYEITARHFVDVAEADGWTLGPAPEENRL